VGSNSIQNSLILANRSKAQTIQNSEDPTKPQVTPKMVILTEIKNCQ